MACPGARFRVLLFALSALAAFSLCCADARADAQRRVSQVDIDAVVDTSGTITVVEERVFGGGDENFVEWDIALDAAGLSGRSVDIVGAGSSPNADEAFAIDSYRFFTESDVLAQDSYNVANDKTDAGAVKRVRLAAAPGQTQVRLWVAYEVTGDVGAWDDCGELRWNYVSASQSCPLENVRCTVHLPVSDRARVEPGGNVRAWQHGGHTAGETSVGDGDIVATVPLVDAKDSCELRAVFPAEWLSGMQAQAEKRLDKVVEEEDARTREADSAYGAWAAARNALLAAGLAAGAAAAVFSAATRLGRGRAGAARPTVLVAVSLASGVAGFCYAAGMQGVFGVFGTSGPATFVAALASVLLVGSCAFGMWTALARARKNTTTPNRR